MTLPDARTAISQAIARMNTQYGRTLFDEWVMVSLKADRGAILAYEGPRADRYKASFTRDLEGLRKDLAEQKLAVGDFAFAAAAAGESYDCCLRLGDSAYLFCNNIAATMDELRKDPRWIQAQKVWAELSQKFHSDPLV